MEKSLFIPLREEGLTTMRIRYDFKTDAVRLYAAKEWEPDHDFAGYNHTWWIDGIYTEDARYLNTREVYALFEKYGQREYLDLSSCFFRFSSSFASLAFRARRLASVSVLVMVCASFLE